MTTATIDEIFEKTLTFEPIKGHVNAYVIRSKKPLGRLHSKEKMAPADWDKFENDIAIFKKAK